MKSTLPTAEQKLLELGVIQFDPKGLIGRLSHLPDRRGQRGRRYELAPLLLLIIFAKLSGEDTSSGIADWVTCRADELIKALHLRWSKMPHHNTLRRIISLVVEPEALDRIVAEHLASLLGVGASRLIAIDGKTVRGTITEANPQGDELLVAYLPNEGIVLGQVAVTSKENEIVEAPKLLGQLNVRGRIVMGDAMHSQRALSEQIKQAGGDFIWPIKRNQPTVLEDITQLFVPTTPTVLGNLLPNDFVSYEKANKGHGRLEKRRITVSSELKGYTEWPYLEQVFQLERWRTNLKTGKSETEVIYGLTSLNSKAATARKLHGLIQDYWGIENGLHQRRDVTFHEDRIRQTIGYAGHVMASINNLVIGLFRHAGCTNIASARRVVDSQFNQTTYLAIERTLTSVV